MEFIRKLIYCVLYFRSEWCLDGRTLLDPNWAPWGELRLNKEAVQLFNNWAFIQQGGTKWSGALLLNITVVYLLCREHLSLSSVQS